MSVAESCLERGDRHILEFVGQDVDPTRQFPDGSLVIEGRCNYRTSICRGRSCRWVEEFARDAKIFTGEAEHLAELTATDDTDTHDSGRRVRLGQYFVRLRLPVVVERSGNGAVAGGEDGGREQCSIDGARSSDRERADRNTAWHLHDREQ